MNLSNVFISEMLPAKDVKTPETISVIDVKHFDRPDT